MWRGPLTLLGVALAVLARVLAAPPALLEVLAAALRRRALQGQAGHRFAERQQLGAARQASLATNCVLAVGLGVAAWAVYSTLSREKGTVGEQERGHATVPASEGAEDGGTWPAIAGDDAREDWDLDEPTTTSTTSTTSSVPTTTAATPPPPPSVVERVSLCPDPGDLALLRAGGYCLSADSALQDKMSSDDVAAVAASEQVLVTDAIRRLLPNRALVRDLATAAIRDPAGSRRWQPSREALRVHFNRTYALERASAAANSGASAESIVSDFESAQDLAEGSDVAAIDTRAEELAKAALASVHEEDIEVDVESHRRRRRLLASGDDTPVTRRKSEALRTSSHFEGSVFVHHKNSAEFGPTILRSSHLYLPPDAPSANMGMRYKSCAVVGSSGILTRALFGEEIDAHDAVFRVNQAPTRGGCATYSGARTTVRVLNAHWLHRYARGGDRRELPLERNVTLVLARYDAKLVSALQGTLLSTERTDVAIRIVSRRVFGALSRVLLLFRKSLEESGLYLGGAGGRVPSTGIHAAYLAMHLCANVSLYGFGLTSARDAATYQEGLQLALRDQAKARRTREKVLQSALSTSDLLGHGLASRPASGALLAHVHGASSARVQESAAGTVLDAADAETIFEKASDELTEESAAEGARLALDNAEHASNGGVSRAWKRLDKRVADIENALNAGSAESVEDPDAGGTEGEDENKPEGGTMDDAGVEAEASDDPAAGDIDADGDLDAAAEDAAADVVDATAMDAAAEDAAAEVVDAAAEESEEEQSERRHQRRRLREAGKSQGGHIWYHYFAHMYGAQKVDRDSHAFDVERLFISTLARTGDLRLCSWRRVDRLREQDSWHATFITARDASQARRAAGVRTARETSSAPAPRLVYREQKIEVDKDGNRHTKFITRSFNEMHHVGQKQMVEELRRRDMENRPARERHRMQAEERAQREPARLEDQADAGTKRMTDLYDRTLAREAALKRKEMTRIDTVTNGLLHGRLNPFALLKQSGITKRTVEDQPRLRKESMANHLNNDAARIAGSALKAKSAVRPDPRAKRGGASAGVDFVDDAKLLRGNDLKKARPLVGPRRPDEAERRASYLATGAAEHRDFLRAKEEKGYEKEPDEAEPL